MNSQLLKIPVNPADGIGREKTPSVLCKININKRTMMTYRGIAFLAILIFTIPAFGQLTMLSEWALNSTEEAAPSAIANVQASDFIRGNGINKITYSSLGARANYWPTATKAGVVDYYEVCITPDPGITLEVDQLEFAESRTADGPGAFEVRWSVDGFSTSELILGQVIPDNTDERKHTISNLDIDICNGNQLCFRFFAYRSEVQTGEWKLGSNSLNIKGEKKHGLRCSKYQRFRFF